MPDRSSPSPLVRLLSPFAQLRDPEVTTALLMFAYSFLAMTSYNIIQPITRSKFITDLGAENIPYVTFAAGLIIGVVMQGYVKATSRLPRRWVIPVSQGAIAAVVILFWILFQTGQEWVSAAFYLLGLIFAILLVSQFWSLANAIYDPRQAKRVFGFIGGGSVLGGMTGAGITALIAETVGTTTLLLWSASALAICIVIVVTVLRRERDAVAGSGVEAEHGLGPREALHLFVSSRQVQLIATIIAFGALGASILDQQLNMAAQEFKGRDETDAITAFLGSVRFWMSAAGLVIQVFLTSRIHRLLGVAFALMILPVGLAVMAGIILANYALWAPAVGRTVDQAFRYTVDKTTREILFQPLPLSVKLQAKPFIDVTVDRLAKGVSSLGLLVLIQPWGLGLHWQQLSYLTLLVAPIWLLMAIRAKREYVASFRRSLEQQVVRPAEIRLDTADLNTIEVLVTELAQADPRRIVYAIDLLEALDRRQFVTPVLLHHESPHVRRRALDVAEAAGAERGAHWAPGAERALKDEDHDVRLAAVRALAAIRGADTAALMRPYLSNADPQLAVTAACALAGSADDHDTAAAAEVLRHLTADAREQNASVRLAVARALGQVPNPAFRPLLVPLMYDTNVAVAREAIASAGRLGSADFLFVAPLVALLRNRRLKAAARTVLVGYGEPAIDALAYFLRDQSEDVWIRRHLPSTLALIPSQRSLDVLAEVLGDTDGFVRHKAGTAIARICRERPDLQLDRTVVDRQFVAEGRRAFDALTLHHNLFVAGGLDDHSMLARALTEKHARAIGRIFGLLALIHPASDIQAVQRTLAQSDARLRAGALEYLDNLLGGETRRRVMILLEDMPAAERIRRGNVIFKTRTRDIEDTVAQLVHDADEVIAAAAIQLVEQREMWALADDLEHALAHRDARDWHVFEAASWALAARRMPPDRRRRLWLEPLPAVEIVDRLRHVPLFDFVSIDELFRIARLGQQVRHETGRVLYARGHTADSLQLLLDGRVVVHPQGATAVEIDAPGVLAFEAVLEGTSMQATVRAATATICLSLTIDEFLSMLSNNVEIAQGIFRLLLETRSDPDWRSVMAGTPPAPLTGRAPEALAPIDRVLLLQSIPLFARATTAQLIELAAIARPVALEANSDPRFGSEPSMVVLLSGTVQVERDGRDRAEATAGDLIGVYETLTGVPLAGDATIVETGSGLRFLRSELFDVLADHIDLLQGIASALMKGPVPAAPAA